MEKRQTVLVMAERSAEITAQLAARFGSRCELLFAENEPDFGAALSRADAIIGEPEEVQLQNARALSSAPAHLGRRGQICAHGALSGRRYALQCFRRVRNGHFRVCAGQYRRALSRAAGLLEPAEGACLAAAREGQYNLRKARARLWHGRPRRKCCAAAVRVRRAGHGRPAHKT